ncbi:hypothetical protein SDC9_194417 [bioreactor metagenome]|uniref:Uncharacterized protein n=1 Tax=bioreactor metagenome TaxID=1076179 RepID=A0A645I6E5_9ZZZZ
MTVHRATAVGLAAAASAPALDGTGVSLAFGNTGDVYLVAFLEDRDINDVADVLLSGVVQLEFAQILLERDSRLGQMTLLGLADLSGLNVLITELHGVVSVFFSRLLLSDDTGPRLNNGDRDDFALLIEDLRHADLLADDTFFHCNSSLVIGWDFPT